MNLTTAHRKVQAEEFGLGLFENVVIDNLNTITDRIGDMEGSLGKPLRHRELEDIV